MKGRKKGVSEIVTVLLLIGIGITSIGTAWHFGNEILSKQKTQNDLEDFERMLHEIGESVDAMANGRNVESQEIDLTLKGSFSINQSDDSIIYVVTTYGSNYAENEVLLNDWLPASSTGVVNINKHGVLSVRSLSVTPEQQTLLYTLKFRPLEDTTTRYHKILDIQSPLQETSNEGKRTLTIVRGEETEYPDTENKKRVIRVPITMTIS